MPTYVFKKADGRVVELAMTFSELEKRQYTREGSQYIKLDGEEVKKIYVPCGGMSSSVWPKESAAAGVAPEQVQEAMAHDRDSGVPTEYNRRTGDAIFTSVKHQRKYLKLHGLVDRDSYL
jgi:hypothetical protein